MGILLLIYVSITNAMSCPEGFMYDVVKGLCVSKHDSSITAIKKPESININKLCPDGNYNPIGPTRWCPANPSN